MSAPRTTDGEPADAPEARRFVDAVGVAWTVREVRPVAPTPAMARYLARFRAGPERGGWLLFESADGEKRRLAPVPPGWSGLTPFVLERWCMRATPARPVKPAAPDGAAPPR